MVTIDGREAMTIDHARKIIAAVGGDERPKRARRKDPDRPAKLRVRRPPVRATIFDLFFNDTVTARMLRRLCEAGEMLQADFSTEYHVRCDRPRQKCGKCDGTGIAHEYQRVRGAPGSPPSLAPNRPDWERVKVVGEICVHCVGEGTYHTGRSSMVNNFGRFIHDIAWGARGTHIWARGVSDDRKPYVCIGRTNATTKKGQPNHRQNVFKWTRGAADDVARVLTNDQLHRAFTLIERQMLTPRKTDVEAETIRWIERLRTEIARRAS
jgi:hypothetical protein